VEQVALHAGVKVLRWVRENPDRAGLLAVAVPAVVVLVLVALLSVLAGAASIFAPHIDTGFRSGPPTGLALAEIPADHLPIFLKAQEKYGVSWAVLAAIAKVESGFGRNMGPSGAGAIGYMQFMPDTWEAYKQDGNGDGKCDPYDPWDAVFTAAYYLKANGFEGDPQGALYQYNHAWWYVTKVLTQAAAYSSMMLPTANGVWPLPPTFRTVTSRFGPRVHPVTGVPSFHYGVDIEAPEGTPVYAALAGVVEAVRVDGALGLYVSVVSTGGVRTVYGHLSAADVSPGAQVAAGQTIGRSGNTGWSTGPHLHFQVEVNGTACDPLEWLGVPAV